MAAISQSNGNQPPITTIQQDTVQYERDLASAAQEMIDLYNTCLDLQRRQAASDYATKFNSTATYALNADGSVPMSGQAIVTDGSPNTAHPMVGLNVSAAEVSAFMGYGVGDFIAWLTGGSPAVTDRRAVIGGLLP